MSFELVRPQAADFITANSVTFTFQDVSTVIDKFYRVVEKDEMLSVPFSTVGDWPHHIERLTHFWWMRLGGRPYLAVSYNPVAKHFEAGFNQEFLARWLGLFWEALNSSLRPEQAELWGTLANRMGEALSAKNEYMRRSM